MIDRTKAIRELKLIAGKTPQSIKVTPDDSLHRNTSVVRIEVNDIAGRALILFDIAGDGTVRCCIQSVPIRMLFRLPDTVFRCGCESRLAVTNSLP